MKQIVEFAFNHRKLIFGISVLLSLVSLYFFVQIRIDNSIETLSIDDDPTLLLLQQGEKTFGGNEFVVISFKGDDIFSPQVLSMIDGMTKDIERIENVESVLSLTNAEVAKDDEKGLGTSLLIPEDDMDHGEANTLKQKAISNRMYEKLLYSKDGNATSIIAWIVPLGSDDAARWRLVNAIKEVLNTHKDGRQFYLYGLPVYQQVLYKISIEDQLVLPSILSFIVGCILLVIFRDIRLVIVPFIVIGMSTLWSMGFFTMEGNTLDVVTFVVPSVLLIVCLCDAVHIISEYRETVTQGADRVELLKAIIARIGMPIMLTSLTTAVGFFSLATSHIRSIRNFGLYTGLGVIFAFFVSVALLPLVMALIPIKKNRKNDDRTLAAFERFLSRLAGWILQHRGSVIGGTIVVVAVCVAGSLRLESNMMILGMLKKNVAKEIIDAQHFVDVEMGGSCEFDVLLKGDRPGSVLTPETLKMIDRIQDRFIKMAGALKSWSITDYLKEMNQVINNNDPAYYRIPDTQGEIDELMTIYSLDGKDDDLEEVVSFDRDAARIRLFTATAPDSKESRIRTDELETALKEESSGSEVSVKFTGRGIVWIDMVESLITEMTKTFSLAFILIFCLMFILFRSWKLGVISAVVNIIPIIVTFGCMGWFHIDLNMVTAMMPSIAIGIAVDDTIHFIWRFEKEFRRHGTYHKAVIHTLETVGKPIVITTILICIGFMVMVFSRLSVLTEFGLLLSLTVAAALLSDLFVAPVLMLLFRPFKAVTDGNACDVVVSREGVVMD